MISLESKRIFPLLNNQTLVLLYTCIKYLSEEEKDREEGGQELRGRVEGRSKGGGAQCRKVHTVVSLHWPWQRQPSVWRVSRSQTDANTGHGHPIVATDAIDADFFSCFPFFCYLFVDCPSLWIHWHFGIGRLGAVLFCGCHDVVRWLIATTGELNASPVRMPWNWRRCS